MATDPPSTSGRELLEHAAFVRRLASRLVVDRDEADDVAQEALLAGWRRPDRARSLRGWLGGTVRNLGRLSARGAARRRRRELAVAGRPLPSTDPSDALALMEVQRRVVEAVTSLDEPYRSTIVHRYFHDLAPAAIARLSDVPVETVRSRLGRAHGLLRTRLDRIHGTRAAWAGPLAPLVGTGSPTSEPSPSSSSSLAEVIVTTKTKVALVVLPLLAAALGALASAAWRRPEEGRTSTAALRDENRRLADENRDLRERLSAATTPPPALEGRPAAGGAAAGTTEAAPERAPVATPAPAPADAPKPSVAGLEDLDWGRWIPVLARYEALGPSDDPPEDLMAEMQAFLSALAPKLGGRRWEDAEDLFRMSDVASQIAVAAAEHFGARLAPEDRSALRGELRSALDGGRVGPETLKIEAMAATLRSVAQGHRVLERRIGEERAGKVTDFLLGLLQDRGWGTLELGPQDEEGFVAVVSQLFGMRARLEGREREDAQRVVGEWWRRASDVLAAAERAHGGPTLRAAVQPANEDDAAAAASRAAPTFAGVRAALWADLAQEQARAERAFHGVWKAVPEARRMQFDRAEPALLLFTSSRE
jgi:RNA polymerase sigma-70 factor (ECF subfamily)